MANASLTDKYKTLLKGLFPRGWAWNQNDEGSFAGLVMGMSSEAASLEERGLQFLTEMDPNQTFEMIDNWERFLGIPDDCTPSSYNPSLYERRQRILQKLTTGGGQSKAFFQLIIQQLGYNTEILDVVNFKDFRAGEGVAGDRITNSTTPGGGVNAAGWAFAFAIQAPATLSREFRAGQGSAGDRLKLVNNETLECVVKRYAPAHTTVLFFYE